MKNTRTWLVGISGGSGSGKTTLANKIVDTFKNDIACVLLGQDRYYRDQSHAFDKDGGSVNFDHPAAIDFSLLMAHAQQLKAGKTIEAPIYDFSTHSRIGHELVSGGRLVVIEGTLIFHDPGLQSIFDLTCYVDADESLRFQRRLKRDVNERGRQPEGVWQQIKQQVKPMHDTYVEEQKLLADIVYNDEADFLMVAEKVRALVK